MLFSAASIDVRLKGKSSPEGLLFGSIARGGGDVSGHEERRRMFYRFRG
jgi:hypothetical protein